MLFYIWTKKKDDSWFSPGLSDEESIMRGEFQKYQEQFKKRVRVSLTSRKQNLTRITVYVGNQRIFGTFDHSGKEEYPLYTFMKAKTDNNML